MKKFLIASLLCLITAATASTSANAAAHSFIAVSKPAFASAKGPTGQTLTASPTKNLPVGKTTNITVSGKGYSTKHGIYATFCVIPPKGGKPDLCGPFDITGKNNQSVWISSNPPVYGLALAKPFGKGGTFKVTVPVQSTIGDFDCTVLKCAILTRADHTQPDYRKADVIIPVTFK